MSMRIRNKLSAILLGTSVALSACIGKVEQQAPKLLENDVRLETLVADTFSRNISDKAKVIEYNRLLKQYNKPVDNYIIVDKKQCTATVYTPDGTPIYKAEVALGKNIGDKRGGGYGIKGKKVDAYTTPGEYEICREGTRATSKDHKLYGDRCLALSGDHTQEAYKKTQILALHRVPASPMGKLREEILQNNTIKDNRVSFGCVNFLTEAYDSIRSHIKGLKTKVYILPEEKGNSLHLEQQKDGSFKFFQTKYRYESQEHKK